MSRTRPIVIWQRSAHEFYLNDAALKYFEITEADFRKAPGYANYAQGNAFEAGLFTVTKPILDYIGDPAQFERGLELMTTVLHKGGLTTIGEQGFPQIDLAMERGLNTAEVEKATTPYRYLMVPNAMFLYPRLKSGAAVLAFTDALVKTGADKVGFLRAIKFYVDGAIFSQLMIMSQPYEDHHHGIWMMQQSEQEEVFDTFWKAGWTSTFTSTGWGPRLPACHHRPGRGRRRPRRHRTSSWSTTAMRAKTSTSA